MDQGQKLVQSSISLILPYGSIVQLYSSINVQ